MIFKRFFDITAAFIGIILMSPFFILIGLIIKLVMPGPIFFIQNRVGKDGVPFRLIKFRTMFVNHNNKVNFEPGESTRITRFGRILRKTKLDELPQLINVIKGQMSLVGPRPEVKEWTLVYPEKWRIVHTVKPGITDNASLLFRNEEEILKTSSDPYATYKYEILPRKLEMYISYVKNRTLITDINIILKTIKDVIIK